MCPLDLEAGMFLVTLKVEATWRQLEESVKGGEMKAGSVGSSFKKVSYEEEVTGTIL